MVSKKILIVPIIILILIFGGLGILKFTDSNSPLYQIKENVLLFLSQVGIYEKSNQISVLNNNFVLEEFISGLDEPTTIAFVEDDILVLEKKKGTVRLIKDGILQKEPILDVEVSHIQETGMLGILEDDSQIYLYYTESDVDGGVPIRNVIYKYQWDGEKLTNPILLNVLPVHTFNHVGGVFTKGLDGTIYAVTGDQTLTGEDCNAVRHYRENPTIPCRIQGENSGIFHNVEEGEIDDTAMIFKVGIDPNEPSPMKSTKQMEQYFAIGIRNSFGLSVDPFTNSLWITENGTHEFDEINLTFPKYNSGWSKILGPATSTQLKNFEGYHDYIYSDPEFSWEQTVAPTGISFVDERWSEHSQNVFVGDCAGNLYKFQLNQNRDGFIFQNNELKDLVLNSEDPNSEIIFGENFGCITDIEFSHDGYLYVISYLNNGAIYKITPK